MKLRLIGLDAIHQPTEAPYNDMSGFYQSLFGFLPFAPPVLALSGERGISPILSTPVDYSHDRFVAIILVLPIYIYFLGVLEPASIQYPGRGDGFAALLYLWILFPTVLLYSVFSFFTRTRPDRTGHPQTNQAAETGRFKEHKLNGSCVRRAYLHPLRS